MDNETTHYQLVGNAETLKRFVREVMPEPPEGKEDYMVYFLSMAARNKYLSTKEREEIGVGRSEMFNRTSVFANKMERGEAVLRAVRNMETPVGSYYGRASGEPLPDNPHVLTLYANLDLANTLEAWNAAAATMNTTFMNLALGRDVHVPNPEGVFRTELQRSKAVRKLVDVDADVPFLTMEERFVLVETFMEEVRNAQEGKPVKAWVVLTTGGFHLLFDKDTLKHNYMETVRAVVTSRWLFSNEPWHGGPDRPDREHTLESLAEFRKVGCNQNPDAFPYDPALCEWEVTRNDNRMVPLPGTYQPVASVFRNRESNLYHRYLVDFAEV